MVCAAVPCDWDVTAELAVSPLTTKRRLEASGFSSVSVERVRENCLAINQFSAWNSEVVPPGADSVDHMLDDAWEMEDKGLTITASLP